jgi:2,3-bisphosphoglycerate-independent phosphoglycerate mutase
MKQSIKAISKKVLLVILDGYGVNPNTEKNAIKDARKPELDDLFENYPFTTIEAGGEKVGLPKGVVGNSEVGHMNLGAGRSVRQDLVRINESIDNDSFKDLPLLKELKEKAKQKTKRIHLIALLSDGGVHSHIEHIKKTIECLGEDQELEVFFHAFMDGRDTQKNVGYKYIDELKKVEGFTFASMQGRSIGMDRDRRWEKIKTAMDCFEGRGLITKLSPEEYIQEQYKKDVFDEFIEPALFNPNAAIQDDDCLFFLNFRPDRASQLSLAYTDPNFDEFKREVTPGYFLCMTPYIPDEVELPILFDKEKLKGTLGEFFSSKGIKQLKIAETEKYAHVAFFFNGGEKTPFKGEDHVLIPSPKEVSTYDQKPEMSAHLVTDRLVKALESEKYDFTLVNFANSDMVGHTGNYEAAVKAIEVLDLCVGRLKKVCAEKNILMLLCADHGNSDQMTYEDGSPHTSHTGAPVPFSAFHPLLKNEKIKTYNDKALMDVATTVLHGMGIEKPKEFTGETIFE